MYIYMCVCVCVCVFFFFTLLDGLVDNKRGQLANDLYLFPN